MTARFFDWIWHIRGSLALSPEQTSEDAFARLDPLFRETGTSHERTGDTLTFRKKDPAAQDKMSVFDGGVLQIERDAAGPVLRYRLKSRALLFCFFAPLLFLAFGQLTVVLGKMDTPASEEKEKEGKDAKTSPEATMNPIDKWLGAPEPEKKEDKDADKKGDKKEEAKNKRFSPTSAYVFAGIFAVLYLVGRVLEARLVRGLFRRRLAGL